MPIGEPFIELIEVQSTNNYAMAQVQAQLAEHGFTWFAHSQTGGKGQRGKAWLTEPGENIALSILISPEPLKLADQFILSAAVALACFDFFSTYAQSDVKIKWPNDIYWKDRKAGGILIENVVHGENWKYAIVGIGLNINQITFSSHLPNPVSLRQITGKSLEPLVLAKELCGYLQVRWQQVLVKNTSAILADYQKHLYKLHDWVHLKSEGAVLTAMVNGITQRGELLVSPKDEHEIRLQQAEWIFP